MPCASLVLKDVICPACSRCTNIDLCSLTSPSPACPSCAAPLSIPALESRLISQLALTLSSYLVQDLSCLKCGPAASTADSMQADCKRCSSVYSFKGIQASQVAEQAAIMRRLAPVLGMRALTSYLQQLDT